MSILTPTIIENTSDDDDTFAETRWDPATDTVYNVYLTNPSAKSSSMSLTSDLGIAKPKPGDALAEKTTDERTLCIEASVDTCDARTEKIAKNDPNSNRDPCRTREVALNTAKNRTEYIDGGHARTLVERNSTHLETTTSDNGRGTSLKDPFYTPERPHKV